MLSLMSLRSHHFSGWPQVTVAMVSMRTLQPRGTGSRQRLHSRARAEPGGELDPPPHATAPSLTALDSRGTARRVNVMTVAITGTY